MRVYTAMCSTGNHTMFLWEAGWRRDCVCWNLIVLSKTLYLFVTISKGQLCSTIHKVEELHCCTTESEKTEMDGIRWIKIEAIRLIFLGKGLITLHLFRIAVVRNSGRSHIIVILLYWHQKGHLIQPTAAELLWCGHEQITANWLIICQNRST